MTDQTSSGPILHAERHVPRSPRAEFAVYFGIIFLATLPLAVLTWALHAVKQGRIPEKGPVARAWSQARIITPMIFSA
jgi:hypothetical protein